MLSLSLASRCIDWSPVFNKLPRNLRAVWEADTGKARNENIVLSQ